MAHLEVLADAACLVVPTSEPGAPAVAPEAAPAPPNLLLHAGGTVIFSNGAKAPPLLIRDPTADERSPSAPFPHGTLKLDGIATTSPAHLPVMVSHCMAPSSAPSMGPFPTAMRMMQTTCEMAQPALSAPMPHSQQATGMLAPLPIVHSGDSDTPTVLAQPGTSDEDKDYGCEEPSVGGKLDRPCSACRLSRVRCNRMMPCSRCTRLGLECKQPRKVQRGRPSHKARLARAQLQAQQAQVEAQHTMAQVHALASHAPGPFSLGVMNGAPPGARPLAPPGMWPAMSPPMAQDVNGLASHGDLPPPPPGMMTHERLTQLLEIEMQHGQLVQVVQALRAQLRRLGSMPCA